MTAPFYGYIPRWIPAEFDNVNVSGDPWGQDDVPALIIPQQDGEPSPGVITALDEWRAAELCEAQAAQDDEVGAAHWRQQAERHRALAKAISVATAMGVVL